MSDARTRTVRVSGTWRGPLIRQSPGSAGRWADCTFVFDNERDIPCDHWVICGDVGSELKGFCAPENVILLCGEPPALRRTFNARYLAQFGAVASCDAKVAPHAIETHPVLPWHVGLDFHRGGVRTFGYDELVGAEIPEKTAPISVVVSDKTFTRGQVLRRRLVERLSARLGDRLHVYGRGGNSVGDKWQAVAPYRYHLALENSRFPNYWTEKLGDAYLAGCLPLYWGAPNVAAYFPAESFIEIDLHRADAVVALIERLLAGGEWARRRAAIADARRRVLDDYNFFAVVARLCGRRPAAAGRSLTLRPEISFEGRVRRRLRSALHGAIARTGCLDVR